jgi:hypothetical protein
MAIQIEHTDTFGGEANYCWANRWHCKAPLTDRQTVRLAKRLAGLTGVRCRTESYGDEFRIYPAGICQVVFVTYAEDDHAEGTEVDRRGEELSQ